jgi:hypothetical protein
MPIDKSQYRVGMYMIGALHPGGFPTAGDDPRLADLRARTAALAATAAKVELLKKRIAELAAQVKRR